MKVFEIMTIEVGFCTAADNLGQAVAVMWQKDCGGVPVLDADKRVIGFLTDRDMAVASATQNRKPSDILVGELLRREAVTCRMEDKIKTVLSIMRREQIRRLPVCGERGELLGIISLNDIIAKSVGKKSVRKQIILTLQALAKPLNKISEE